MIPWIQNYIGIKYTDNFNCWDFIRFLFKEYHDFDVGKIEDQTVNIFDGDWFSVRNKQYREFDIILFRTANQKHVGLIINDRLFIHNDETIGHVCIESYEANKWKNRICKIYRHRRLM